MHSNNKTEQVQITEKLQSALKEIENNFFIETKGKWLEHLTVEIAVHLKDWDVSECWSWSDWPERDNHPYYKGRGDIGVDVVARRKSDGKYIAIQCKSRKHEDTGSIPSLTLGELGSFFSTSSDHFWAERWLVSNGASITKNALNSAGSKPVKELNLGKEILNQLHDFEDKSLPPSIGSQSRDSMQEECIDVSVSRLRALAKSASGKSARGRIILPCGTGKSRIALRIVERLTNVGEVSVVFCPSIALVAQLRREFLVHSDKEHPMRVMAVCSDKTAGVGSDLAHDPTVDTSSARTCEVKGFVTTDPKEISRWIHDISEDSENYGVIFSTYQSSHQIADAVTRKYPPPFFL